MSFIEVDQKKCTACGTCAAECPVKLLTLEGNIAAPVEQAETYCLRCSHCVVFCPEDAIKAAGFSPEDCPAADPLPSGASTVVTNILKNRRSIRTFKNTPVEKEVLEQIMETMCYTPTGCNTQLNNWLVISDKKKIKEIGRLTGNFLKRINETMADSVYKKTMRRTLELIDRGKEAVTLNAPHLVFVTSPIPIPTDSIIAMSQLEIAAYSYGLGPCWAGWINMAAQNDESLQKNLELPEGHLVQGVMMLGYPQYTAKRIPVKKPLTIRWS